MEIKGLSKRMLSIENNKVILKQNGIGFLQSKKEKSIPISKISAVQVTKPSLFGGAGYIQLTLAGGIEKNNRFGGAVGAMYDENSVCFHDEFSYKTALKIKDYIENYSESTPIRIGATSIADEIMKFKKLLDEEIITKEEFEKMKKELLK